jgi:hypothetical protein
MKRLWRNALVVALAACVSFDPAGPPVRDISGTYTATVVTRLANAFETRSDTFPVTLDIRNTGDHGGFTGSYRTTAGDTGPFGGTLRTDDSVILYVFGDPPKPIAGVSYIRDLYPWCDFSRLGIGPMPGAVRGDSLFVDGHGSVPCFYGVGGGFLQNAHTDVFLTITAAR